MTASGTSELRRRSGRRALSAVLRVFRRRSRSARHAGGLCCRRPHRKFCRFRATVPFNSASLRRDERVCRRSFAGQIAQGMLPMVPFEHRGLHANADVSHSPGHRVDPRDERVRHAVDAACRCGKRRESRAAGAAELSHSNGARREGDGLAFRKQAVGCERSCGQCIRRRSRSSALALRAAQWRCARRRDRCAAQARRPQGLQGLGHEEAHEQGRLRHAERKPHHAAARRRWRRRRRDA